MNYQTSAAGLSRLKASEALRLFAYPDVASPLAVATKGAAWGFRPAAFIFSMLAPSTRTLKGDPWTIGWGTTTYPDGRKVGPDDSCTEDQADRWLEAYVQKLEDHMNRVVTNDVLTQGMFDALMSWGYNVGNGAVQRSELLEHLNAGRWIQAQAEFDDWTKAGGKVGVLKRRRDEEQQLFNDGIRSVLAHDPVTLKLFNDYVASLDR